MFTTYTNTGKFLLFMIMQIMLAFISKETSQVYGQTISKVEWYIDTDPGKGLGNDIPITSSADVSTFFDVDCTNLPTGLHVIAVRSKDNNGSWSFDEKWLILKQAAVSNAPNIDEVEWYFDTDPGYGNAKQITGLTPGQDLSTIFFDHTRLDTLSNGLHVFGIRSRNTNGTWSFDEKWLVLKQAAASNAPNIDKVEWYFDTDPGYGNANPIPGITPGQDLSTVFFEHTRLDTLSTGLHVFAVRSRNSNGTWSFDEKWLVLKQPLATPLPGFKKIEYYLDTDPGYGNGTTIAFADFKDLSFLPMFINVSGLSEGAHKIAVRSCDASNTWSFDDTLNFTIKSAVTAPAILVNSVDFTPVCLGDHINIGFDATGTYNQGNIFTAQLSDANGSFANPVDVGNIPATKSGIINCNLANIIPSGNAYKIRVKSSDPVFIGQASNQKITINQFSVGADTIAFLVCSNQTFNINSILSVAGSNVSWSVNISNPDSVSLGLYSAYISSPYGCKDTINIEVKKNVAIWQGDVSTDWHDPLNWDTGEIPGERTHVIIKTNAVRDCIINSADAEAASIQLIGQPVNASLKINAGRKLMIKANCESLPPGN